MSAYTSRDLVLMQGLIEDFMEKLRQRERSAIERFQELQIRRLLDNTKPKIRALRMYLQKRIEPSVPVVVKKK